MNTNKSGFGIMEVLAAAVVLGFLIVGLTRLQTGNREATLRIRTRDAAQIVAQEFIDSLSKVGANSIEGTEIEKKVTYKWQGRINPSRTEDNITSEIEYTIIAKIDDDKIEKSIERSNLTDAMSSNTEHIMAKRIDLTVKWMPFKARSKSELSISLSRIIK
jgi:hypothetical protein